MAQKKSKGINIKVEGCDCNHDGCCKGHRGKGCGSGVYWVGFIGAAIYYISTASGFWMGVLGLLKACVWPAFLVFELLKFLGA
jgi:hypothetical protein